MSDLHIQHQRMQIKIHFQEQLHLKVTCEKSVIQEMVFIGRRNISEKSISHLNTRVFGSYPFPEIVHTASLEEWSTAASSTGKSYPT